MACEADPGLRFPHSGYLLHSLAGEGTMLGLFHRPSCGQGLAALVLLLSTTIAAAQTRNSLRDFFAAYRCNIVDRLERIYESGDPSDPMDRFIAVTAPVHPHGYVQCM